MVVRVIWLTHSRCSLSDALVSAGGRLVWKLLRTHCLLMWFHLRNPESDEVSVVDSVEVVLVSGSVEVVAGELGEDSGIWSSCVGSRA